jgi:hypothetical protein
MAYEYPVVGGVVHLLKVRRRWLIDFNGKRHGRWPTLHAAARAVSQR